MFHGFKYIFRMIKDRSKDSARCNALTSALRCAEVNKGQIYTGKISKETQLNIILSNALPLFLSSLIRFSFKRFENEYVSQASLTSYIYEIGMCVNFLSCPVSSISHAVELPYDFEVTSEFSILTFSCRSKKKLHKNCRVFASIVTLTLTLLSVKTSKFFKEKVESKSYITRPN